MRPADFVDRLQYGRDHLCGMPACVNPEHLELVTPAENNRRARERRALAC